ncbi:MAG: hypothetical protein A2033_08170 [Bacteroidetes bacterium GWA2_31_9]|nr:MAG: hypothetical protein A2033_08170 [Bacteroidetes bacterium GWA2_31_9]
MDYASKIFKNGLSNSVESHEYIQICTKLIEEKFTEISVDIDNAISINGKKGEKTLAISSFKKGKNISSYTDLINKQEFLDSLMQFIGSEFLARNVWFAFGDEQFRNILEKHKTPFSISNKVTVILLNQALRIVALLHDIGHLPFSHIFEFAIENLKDELEKVQNENNNAKSVLDDIYSILKVKTDYSGDKLHEIIGKNITKFIFADLKNNESQNAIFNSIFVLLIEIICKEISKGESGKLNSLYGFISGTIDADRLDFIQRDGANSGISISTGNIDRILKMFQLIKQDDKYFFLPAIQAIHDIEEILHDRYKIYKHLVNHHAVKRSDYIFQNVLEKIIYEDIVALNNLTNENDNVAEKEKKKEIELDSKNIKDVINITKEIIQPLDPEDYKMTIYRFSQITDFWLLSLLNKEFYKRLGSDEPKKDRIFLFLKEVYENTRSFQSLWKRNFEYDDFLNLLGQQFIKDNLKYKVIPNTDGHTLLKLIAKEKENYKKISSKKCYTEVNKKCITSKYNKLNCDSSNNNTDECLEIQHKKIGRLIIDFYKKLHGKGGWCRNVEERIYESDFNNIILLVQPKLNSGIDSLNLVENKSDRIVAFSDVSCLKSTIEADINAGIQFFAYYNGSIEQLSEKNRVNNVIIKNILIYFTELIEKNNQTIKDYVQTTLDS